MIAPTGKNTVFGLYGGKQLLNFFGLFNRFKFIVIDVACDNNKIRIGGVDFFHHLFHMAGADAVAQMQVGGQHNIQFRNITWFVNVSIIMGRPYPAGVDDAEYGDDYRQQKGAASCEDDKMPAAQCMPADFFGKPEYENDSIHHSKNKNNVEHKAKPYVIQFFQ